MVELKPGATFGKYRIDRIIGSGGSGTVYLAQDINPMLPRRVALKVLNGALLQEEGFRRRFREEALLATMPELESHPNIVTIYDADEHDGVPYIAMQYVDGKTLQDRIEDVRRLSKGDTVFIISSVADALDTLHNVGIIHRDVKPGNILLSPKLDRVYLSDFGIAKNVRSAARTSGGKFTLLYAAPEQLSGGPVDARTDVYSLGCTSYECLTGSPPFAEDKMVVMANHLQAPPPKVTEKCPELSAAIDDVIARAMAKDPEQRYRTCGELATAVQDALAETSDVGKETRRVAFNPIPVSGAVMVPTSRGSWRRYAMLAALVTGLSILGAMLLLHRTNHFPNERERGLLRTLPVGFRDTCGRGGELAPGDEGWTAVVSCVPGDGADEVSYIQFLTHNGLDRAYSARLEGHGIQQDASTDCATNTNVDGPYSTTDTITGRVACYRDGGSSFMIWTLPELRVLAIAERLDRNDRVLYTWWVELEHVTTTTTTAAFPNPAEKTLVDHVPVAFRNTCRRTSVLEGASVTVVCSPQSGATRVFYNQFPNADAMNSRYTSQRPVSVAASSGAFDACPREQTYTINARTAGRSLCFVEEGGRVRIIWTNTDLLVSAEAHRDDGNAQELQKWWKDSSGPV